MPGTTAVILVIGHRDNAPCVWRFVIERTGTPRVRFRYGEYTRTSAACYATMTLTVRDDRASLKAYAMEVGDAARARAFFDSPGLAEHMVKNAGVIGAPERHFWNA